MLSSRVSSLHGRNLQTASFWDYFYSQIISWQQEYYHVLVALTFTHSLFFSMLVVPLM